MNISRPSHKSYSYKYMGRTLWTLVLKCHTSTQYISPGFSWDWVTRFLLCLCTHMKQMSAKPPRVEPHVRPPKRREAGFGYPQKNYILVHVQDPFGGLNGTLINKQVKSFLFLIFVNTKHVFSKCLLQNTCRAAGLT